VLFSYAGTLCWGFTAEWDLLPDLHDFVLDVESSFGELAELPAAEASAAPAPRRRRAKRPAPRPSAPVTG
jgi:hypothetical protein